MKKNVKHLIIAVSAAVLLGAALTAVLMIPDSKKLTDSDNESKVLFDKTDCIAEQITVKNSGGEFYLLGYDYSREASELNTQNDEVVIVSGNTIEGQEMIEDEEEIYVVYTMQDHENLTLSKTLTDIMARQLKSMTALETVDKSGSRYKDYGLDTPDATVSVTFSDNSSYTFYVGAESPEGTGIYVKLGGDDNVYLVDKETMTSFFFEKLQMFDKQLSVKMDDFASLSISGTGYEKEIDITTNTMNIYPGKYIMTSPDSILCDESKTSSVMSSAQNFLSTWIAAIDVTESDIEKYSLDKPYQYVKMEGGDGTVIEMIASKADEENKFYIMNPGGKIIYQCETSDAQWYDIKANAFYTDNVYNVNIDMINKLEVIADGKTDTYTVTREKKLSQDYYVNYLYNVSCEGEEISYKTFTSFIVFLTNIKCSDEAPQSLDGCTELFRTKMSYFEHESYQDELAVYSTKDGKAVAVFNGRIVTYFSLEFAQRIKGLIPYIKSEYDPERFSIEE